MFELLLPFDTEIIQTTVAHDETDDDCLVYHVQLKKEVTDWCKESLFSPISLIVDTSKKLPGFFIVFGNPNDMLLFKLRWI